MLYRIGTVLTFISALLMAAHFMRHDIYIGVAISLLTPALLFLRHTWATRIVQLALVSSSLVWVMTMFFIAGQRMEQHKPWTRMAVILSVVAAVPLIGSLMLLGKRKEKQVIESDDQPAGEIGDK